MAFSLGLALIERADNIVRIDFQNGAKTDKFPHIDASLEPLHSAYEGLILTVRFAQSCLRHIQLVPTRYEALDNLPILGLKSRFARLRH